MTSEIRHPRREAQDLVGDDFAATVLEPSPPAVMDGAFFADDPVADPNAASGPPVVWQAWLAEHPEHAAWGAERWLGAYIALPPLPVGFADTRLGLHRLAVYVLSPARRRVNGKIGLRWTMGGFGTPFFGADEQVRVAGDAVVCQRGEWAAAEPITTLAAAADFILDGPPDLAWAEPFDVPEPGDVDADLGVDPVASAWLGNWYGFAWSVLEELRADPASVDAGRVQLWPEHFDAAFDCLGDDRRAGYGASPGDRYVEEPYLYVVPHHFDRVPASPLWNAPGFNGAVLPFSHFAGSPDQRGAALAFYRDVRALLAS